MKVQLEIDRHILEDLVTIAARQHTSQISQLVEYIQKLDTVRDRLKVKRGEEVYLLDIQEMYRLVIEDRKLHIKTHTHPISKSEHIHCLWTILFRVSLSNP